MDVVNRYKPMQNKGMSDTGEQNSKCYRYRVVQENRKQNQILLKYRHDNDIHCKQIGVINILI